MRAKASDQQDHRKAGSADHERDGICPATRDAFNQQHGFLRQGLGLDREAEHFRQLSDDDRERNGVQETEAYRFRQQVGDHSQAREADQQ